MKKLILIRHAHRDTSQRELDNGLSEKGRRQAKAITSYFTDRYAGAKPLLLSSAKKRCQETVAGIAQAERVDLKISPLLMERLEHEKSAAFRSRISDFSDWWMRKAPDLVVACSHGDWLPLAIEELTRARVDLSKGAWAEIDLINERPVLAWLLQDVEGGSSASGDH